MGNRSKYRGKDLSKTRGASGKSKYNRFQEALQRHEEREKAMLALEERAVLQKVAEQAGTI